MEEDFKECELILDSRRGIYIPRDFATTINIDLVKDAEKYTDDLEICKNPDHEHYWEAWQNILDNMQIDLMGNGVLYSLYQDGDLFAVIYKDTETDKISLMDFTAEEQVKIGDLLASYFPWLKDPNESVSGSEAIEELCILYSNLGCSEEAEKNE